MKALAGIKRYQAILAVMAVMVMVWGGVVGAFSLREEFGTALLTSGNIGQLGWLVTNIGAAPTIANEIGTYPNLSRTKMTTTATSGQGGSLSVGAVSPLGDTNTYTNWGMTYIFSVASAGSQSLHLGMGTGADAPGSTAGAWVRYDTNAGDAQFFFECRMSSVSTVGAMGPSPVAGTFYKARIWSRGVGTVNFSVNNGPTYQCTTNVPSGNMIPHVTLITRLASAKTVVLDFFSFGVNANR